MPDSGRSPGVCGLTSGELERTRRELQATLALARPDSPARGPIQADLSAIDTELAERRRTASRGQPMIYLCSCGFGTDDGDWFDGHQFQRPGHYEVPMAR